MNEPILKKRKNVECNICAEDFDTTAELAKHLRSEHDLTEKKYCLEVLKKTDFLTGEPIPYRSFEQYLITSFTGRANLLKWLKTIDKQHARQFLWLQLMYYAKVKHLDTFPSHFELRTINSLVSVKTYVHFFENDALYKMIKECGLQNRFSYFSDLKMPTLPAVIYEDTREKKPIKFEKNTNVEVKKLDYGDYSAGGDIFIERKSLPDLLGTLSSGWARFQNEMARAKENGHYVVIVVDTDINSFMSYSYNSHIHTKASPEFIFKRCRDLCRAFPDTIQFLFSGGRRESAKVIPILLGWGKDYCSKLDLQYYKDTGALDKLCG